MYSYRDPSYEGNKKSVNKTVTLTLLRERGDALQFVNYAYTLNENYKRPDTAIEITNKITKKMMQESFGQK